MRLAPCFSFSNSSFGESLFSETASSVVLTGIARPWSKSQEGSIWLIGYSYCVTCNIRRIAAFSIY